MTNKIKKLLWFIGTYITIVGVVTFSQFILEEAIQTAIWGTWPAQDAKDWPLVKEGLIVITSINTTLKIITYSLGWIQPLAMIGYLNYVKSTEYYLKGLNAKIFANAPELYIDEDVEFTFYPSELKTIDGNEIAVNGRIGVYTKNLKDQMFNSVRVKGKMIYNKKHNLLVVQ